MQQWEATSRGGEWLYRAAVGDIDAEQAWRYDLNETGQGGYTKPSGSNGTKSIDTCVHLFIHSTPRIQVNYRQDPNA